MNPENKSIQKRFKSLAMAAVLAVAPMANAKNHAKASVENGKEITIKGIVKTSRPISNAMIRVFTDKGKLLTEQSHATSKNGFFKVKIAKNLIPSHSHLVVESIGGENGTEKFDGHLYSNLEVKDNEEIVHLNTATSLSSLYQEHHAGTTKAQADAKVQKFLGVPTDVDLGFVTQNPKLKSYSETVLEEKAVKEGGHDVYTQNLVKEMSGNSKAVHSFPAPKSKLLKDGPVGWIGEQLLAGVVGDLGSNIFSGFLSGTFYSDDTAATQSLLAEIVVRIAEIQSKLKAIEIDIAQSEYNIRSSELWDQYSEILGIVKRMEITDAEARANASKPGGATEEENKQIIQAGKKFVEKLRALDSKFVDAVHSQFVTDEGITPLQQIFAKVQYLKSPIVSKAYFDNLKEHMEKYKSYQAMAAALIAEAYKAGGDPLPGYAKNLVKYTNQLLEEEKFIYPEGASLFSSTDLASIVSGDAIYDKDANLVWMTKFKEYETCMELNYARGTVGDYSQIEGLLVRSGEAGKTFATAIKNIGFDSTEADSTKMVVFGCHLVESNSDRSINWFGNDQRGVWDQYYDSLNDFNALVKSKEMSRKGFVTMEMHTLK